MEQLRILLMHGKPVDEIKQLTMRSKIGILNDMIKICKTLPKQRSQEWLRNRFFTIGGSEIATVDSTFKLVKTRLFPEYRFSGSTATRLGNIFEEVSILLMNHLFGIEILEFPALPGALPYTAYSPDGISIIWRNGVMMIVLWEFKSPYTSGANGTIPTKYVPQISLGLQSIPFLDGVNFVNAVYKVCSFMDFASQTNRYNKLLYTSHKDVTENDPIHARGMLLLYDNGSEQMTELFAGWGEDPIDCGGLDKPTFDIVLKEILANRISVQYHHYTIENKMLTHSVVKMTPQEKGQRYNSVLNDADYFAVHYDRLVNKSKCHGFMCWKLFNFDVIFRENKHENYFNNSDNALTRFGKTMEHFKTCDSAIDHRWKQLKETFPEQCAKDYHYIIYQQSFLDVSEKKNIQADADLFD